LKKTCSGLSLGAVLPFLAPAAAFLEGADFFLFAMVTSELMNSNPNTATTRRIAKLKGGGAFSFTK